MRAAQHDAAALEAFPDCVRDVLAIAKKKAACYEKVYGRIYNLIQSVVSQ